MAVTLHLKTKGKNDHHRVESLFKAFGRTLRQAIRVQGDTLPRPQATEVVLENLLGAVEMLRQLNARFHHCDHQNA